MKLSIITINRNNAEGLRKTIESVVNQTYADFEYIIIDGASTDSSVDVIQQFNNSTIQQFNWISEPDTGVYNAMNKGIYKAQGEYLLFLNSGDFLVDNGVLKNVFQLNYYEDILCGNCNVSDNGKVVWTAIPPENITFGTLFNQGLAHQATFIKRQLFSDLGLYREDFKYNSDIDFWYRAIIVNGASTRKINVLVSDYNLDGISSQEKLTEQYKAEINTILKQSNFSKFIPDYESWNAERKEMEILYWVKSKKSLYWMVMQLYRLAKWFVNRRK